MKPVRALIVIGVLLGASVWHWQGQHRATRPDRTADTMSLPQARRVSDASHDREASDARSVVASATGNQSTSVQAPTPAPAQIVSAEEIKAMDPALVALSPEEAGWLFKHGYPTQAES